MRCGSYLLTASALRKATPELPAGGLSDRLAGDRCRGARQNGYNSKSLSDTGWMRHTQLRSSPCRCCSSFLGISTEMISHAVWYEKDLGDLDAPRRSLCRFQPDTAWTALFPSVLGDPKRCCRIDAKHTHLRREKR